MVHDDSIVVSDSFKWKMRWLRMKDKQCFYVTFCVVIHVCDQTRAPHIYDSHVDVNRHRDRNTHLLGTGRMNLLT